MFILKDTTGLSKTELAQLYVKKKEPVRNARISLNPSSPELSRFEDEEKKGM